MKCEICKQQLQETFLAKLVGGYVKDAKGKKHLVCAACQQKNRTKEELLKALQ